MYCFREEKSGSEEEEPPGEDLNSEDEDVCIFIGLRCTYVFSLEKVEYFNNK